MKSKAFTLIELLVVISIVALLSSVVLASLNAAREKGNIAAGKQFDMSVYHSIADEAIGVWDFEECSGNVTKDLSGNGNTGNLNGAYSSMWSTDTPSGKGCSLNLNGSNQYVSATLNPLPVSAITWSGWFYTRSFPTPYGAVFGNFAYSPLTAGINLIPKNNNNSFWSFFGNGVTYVYDNANVSYGSSGPILGRWLHGVVTYDGTNAKAYINGKLIGSVAITVTHAGTSAVIGRWASSYVEYYFDGLVDSVRVFSKSLTAREVGDLYAHERGTIDVAYAVQ